MIRILTDSACDILPAEAQQLGVTVIPLNVTLEDGTVLRDGIDMTPSEYYTHLAACRKLPTTSQPSPEQFERLYLDAVAAGDEVLGIFLSDALSGTGQCAKLAADLANVDNVVFVNTENVCLGQSLLVRLAVQLRDAGKTHPDRCRSGKSQAAPASGSRCGRSEVPAQGRQTVCRRSCGGRYAGHQAHPRRHRGQGGTGR